VKGKNITVSFFFFLSMCNENNSNKLFHDVYHKHKENGNKSIKKIQKINIIQLKC